MRGKKGFTLIELLIVISVIAILIGIALPRFRGIQDEGRTAKAAGELRTLQTAVESYYIHQNPHAYPAAGATWQTAITAAKPQIVGSALIDPFNGTTQYTFFKSANGQYYVILSVGVDMTADVTGIGDTGTIAGGPDDDIYVSNGTSGTGGF